LTSKEDQPGPVCDFVAAVAGAAVANGAAADAVVAESVLEGIADVAVLREGPMTYAFAAAAFALMALRSLSSWDILVMAVLASRLRLPIFFAAEASADGDRGNGIEEVGFTIVAEGGGGAVVAEVADVAD
jgi:hypothetical protein